MNLKTTNDAFLHALLNVTPDDTQIVALCSQHKLSADTGIFLDALSWSNPISAYEPDDAPDDAPGSDCPEHGPSAGDDCPDCD